MNVNWASMFAGVRPAGVDSSSASRVMSVNWARLTAPMVHSKPSRSPSSNVSAYLLGSFLNLLPSAMVLSPFLSGCGRQPRPCSCLRSNGVMAALTGASARIGTYRAYWLSPRWNSAVREHPRRLVGKLARRRPRQLIVGEQGVERQVRRIRGRGDDARPRHRRGRHCREHLVRQVRPVVEDAVEGDGDVGEEQDALVGGLADPGHVLHAAGGG